MPRGAARRRSTRLMHGLMCLGVVVVIGVLAFGAMVLRGARDDAWRQAEAGADNLTLALTQDIARNISTYDLSIRGVIEAMRVPGIDRVSPRIRQMATFDTAATAEYLGSILVLNRLGDVVLDSTSLTPHKLNFADRDYFQSLSRAANNSLMISRPFRSRLRGGDPTIGIVRRISGPDGAFEGLVQGALRLAYFQDMFGQLELGPHGSMTLIRTDGRLVARQPIVEGNIDRDMSDTPAFRQSITGPFGHYAGIAPTDGVERFFTFRRIGDLPLILVEGIAVEDINAAWRWKAIEIGAILAVLSLAIVSLCLIFRREIGRRLAAEVALLDAVEQLAVIAHIDGLTGLRNRREFDSLFAREWRRAVRSGTTLSLLMLDADCFKPFNDHYGHQEGDRALQAIAGSILGVIRRPADIGARYGGEEFVVILPETDQAGAVVIAARICAAVAALDIAHVRGPFGKMTVSVGVAAARPVRGDEAAGCALTLKAADAALYEAKRLGGNGVQQASEICVTAPEFVP